MIKSQFIEGVALSTVFNDFHLHKLFISKIIYKPIINRKNDYLFNHSIIYFCLHEDGITETEEAGTFLWDLILTITLRLSCENTHLCSSLHKLLTPRQELICGRIEREAGSQGKEQKHKNNFVIKTPRECNTLWIISSSFSFGWQKIILTNWVRLVMSLFVVSLFRPNQPSSNPN